MKYTIGYTAIAENQLLRMDSTVQLRIVAAVDKLADNPRPAGCKKLQGRPGYRIRVGDYRVVYEIHDTVVTVEVMRVGHRSRIYR